jgi:hypothetical protein
MYLYEILRAIQRIVNDFELSINTEKYPIQNLIDSQNRMKQRDTTYQIPPEILQALEQNGCITQNPLQWLKTKSLLGYFVEAMNDKYSLKHGEKRMIKPFETMFNVSGLSGAINDYKKTGDLPIEHAIIDKMLK